MHPIRSRSEPSRAATPTRPDRRARRHRRGCGGRRRPGGRAALRRKARGTEHPETLAGAGLRRGGRHVPGGPLIIGGLDSTESSVEGVFQLDSASGGAQEVGSLTGPLHGAAATVLGNRVLVFGGGTETSTDEVQALSMSGGRVATGSGARQVGRLPTVRSDLGAVTVGNTAYVLGGYDGNEPIPSVLATTGSKFTEVTKLPAPGRYLAVATLGSRIYAFGGETASPERAPGRGSEVIP